jgi:RND superfamily putative drug exporter
MALLPILLRVGGHRIWAQPSWLGRLLPEIRFAH